MTMQELLEEGAASMDLAERRRESLDVIVIGGGQAGLSVGHYLAQTRARFVILEANERIGDSWRKRWDSLRLFTPAKYDGLDGMRFPAPRNSFPTRDEMAAYLEAYAARFRLPVRCGVRVERLFKRGKRYVVTTPTRELEADHIVVAMAKYQRPSVPPFAAGLSKEIVQLHSLDYRSPGQLAPGSVLLVGAGNTGADLAMELAREGRRTWLAGRPTGEVPFRPQSFLGVNVFAPLVLGFVFHHVLTVNTPMGRKVRQGMLSKGGPLIRVKSRDLAAAGVERTPRVAGTHNGLPLLQDERTLPAANVIWCSGFHPAFDWIELPIFDEQGMPKHRSGLVDGEPGLYFIGLPFLHAMSSSMIHGVGRDAARIVGTIEARRAASVPVAGAFRGSERDGILRAP